MLCIHIVECLDDRSAQLTLNPLALDHSGLDLFYTAVALAGIVVAGVHHDHIGRDRCKQTLWEISDLRLGNRHDNQLSLARCFRCRYCFRTGLCGKRSLA